MTKRLRFYAPRDETLAILAGIEKRLPLEYRRIGRYDGPDKVLCYRAAAEIPDFGISVRGETNREPAYLVMKAGARFEPREGDQAYFVGQENNPHSVILTSGGLFTPEILIAGECVTLSQTLASGKLYERFRRVFRSRCKMVHDCFVHPQALGLAKEGVRLTHKAGTSRERDLRIE